MLLTPTNVLALCSTPMRDAEASALFLFLASAWMLALSSTSMRVAKASALFLFLASALMLASHSPSMPLANALRGMFRTPVTATGMLALHFIDGRLS